MTTRAFVWCHQLKGLLGRNVGWNEFLLLVTSIPRVLKLILSIKESEDCLFLNVFTPVVSRARDAFLSRLHLLSRAN